MGKESNGIVLMQIKSTQTQNKKDSLLKNIFLSKIAKVKETIFMVPSNF